MFEVTQGKGFCIKFKNGLMKFKKSIEFFKKLPNHRKLDILIAEEIMGLNVVSYNWPVILGECGLEADHFLTKEELENVINAEYEEYEEGEVQPVYVPEDATSWPPQYDKESDDYYADVELVPFYSTDLEKAQEVIEALLKKFDCKEFVLGAVNLGGSIYWVATAKRVNMTHSLGGYEPAETICRCALLTVDMMKGLDREKKEHVSIC